MIAPIETNQVTSAIDTLPGYAPSPRQSIYEKMTQNGFVQDIQSCSGFQLRPRNINSQTAEVQENASAPTSSTKSSDCSYCGITLCGRKRFKCSQCHYRGIRVLYCDSACQLAHWKYHKVDCKRTGKRPRTSSSKDIVMEE